jgi:adenosylcobinamide kinase/adenosylcobinamide-phosphate guanylyltransferase
LTLDGRALPLDCSTASEASLERRGSRSELDHRRVLVLGGARSGKSAFAERIAAECGEPVLYVATGLPLDDEMAERIRRHQARRSSAWRTLEEPRHVADAVQAQLGDARTVLLEDLTLLLSNVSVAEDVARAEIDALFGLPAHAVLVSNEVGMGIVPEYPLGRAFRDALGRLNQHAAATADEVYLLVAGLPLRLKPGAGRPTLTGEA